MLSNKQNRSTCGFIPLSFKLFLFVAISFVILLLGSAVLGASPFTDNFEVYDVGDLTGQGNWESVLDKAPLQVNTTRAMSGDQSIACLYGNCYNKKTGNDVISGKWVFYLYLEGYVGMDFHIRKDATDVCRVGTTETQYIHYQGSEGWIDTGWPVQYETWRHLQIEWNATENKCRVQYADSDWSEWFGAISTFDYINTLWVGQSWGADGVRYVDYISDDLICDIDNCGICQEYNACINAGCSWYYSLYLQTYYCVPPFEPDPDECGSFYKCQYCGTQSSCENQVNCQWINRGYGEQCYMLEPTIPPGDVVWEIPELDDCNELSGTELWLCEIKNFIAGIFMPGQEKIEVLYQTIGAFKEKFPFNYIGSLNGFFENVAQSLDEERSIPIKILDNESNVNFTFWNTTTTIGGEVETFKNAWFDFTTIIILIGWFVWLISWIKRFF